MSIISFYGIFWVAHLFNWQGSSSTFSIFVFNLRLGIRPRSSHHPSSASTGRALVFGGVCWGPAPTIAPWPGCLTPRTTSGCPSTTWWNILREMGHPCPREGGRCVYTTVHRRSSSGFCFGVPPACASWTSLCWTTTHMWELASETSCIPRPSPASLGRPRRRESLDRLHET